MREAIRMSIDHMKQKAKKGQESNPGGHRRQ